MGTFQASLRNIGFMGRFYLSQASRWQSGDVTWHPWKLILVMAISKRHIQRVEHGSLARSIGGRWKKMVKMIGFSRLWSGVPLEKLSDHSPPAPKKHWFWWFFGLQSSCICHYMTMMHEAPLIFQATIFLRLLVTKSWNVLKILDDLKFGNLSSGIPFTYRKTDVVNKTLHLPVVLWLKNGSKGMTVYACYIYESWVMSWAFESGIMQMVSSALSLSQEMSVTIRF